MQMMGVMMSVKMVEMMWWTNGWAVEQVMMVLRSGVQRVHVVSTRWRWMFIVAGTISAGNCVG